MTFEPENPHKWFTAGEAAIIADGYRVSGVPKTRWGMAKYFKRLAMDDPDEHARSSRRRRGQIGGGGTEFYWHYFPEALYEALDEEVSKRERAYQYFRPLAEMLPTQAEIMRRDAGWSRRKAEVELEQPDDTRDWQMAGLVGFEREFVIFPLMLREFGNFAFPPCPLIFSAPGIRTVERCIVKFRGKKFFSHSLNRWHKRDVLVYACENLHPDLIWCWEYDGKKHRRNEKHYIGDVICTAKQDGNAVPYFPVEFVREAEKRRNEGHARRQAAKLRGKIAKEQYSDFGIFDTAASEEFLSGS